MKAWIAAGLVCALAALLAPPATASARPGWEEKPRSLHLSFHAETSNGYELSVKTTGHRQVALGLAKGGVSATYKTTGKVSREGIEADFGELGELAVEFHGRPTRFAPPFALEFDLPPGFLPHRECRGRRPQQEVGDFRGTIRFEGENGFTRIDTKRAKGKMRRTYRRLCKSGPRFRARGATGGASASAGDGKKLGNVYMNVLAVGGHQNGRGVVFETLGFSGKSGDPFLDELLGALGPFALAATYERHDGMRISRRALAGGDEGSLIVSPPKREIVTATVAFPKPFEGTAEFEHIPGSAPTWAGSLLARLPGAGGVPLTGEGLKTVFCRLSLAEDGIAGGSPCLEEAEKIVPNARRARFLIAQDSGSHSHALADVRLSWSR